MKDKWMKFVDIFGMICVGIVALSALCGSLLLAWQVLEMFLEMYAKNPVFTVLIWSSLVVISMAVYHVTKERADE